MVTPENPGSIGKAIARRVIAGASKFEEVYTTRSENARFIATLGQIAPPGWKVESSDPHPENVEMGMQVRVVAQPDPIFFIEQEDHWLSLDPADFGLPAAIVAAFRAWTNLCQLPTTSEQMAHAQAKALSNVAFEYLPYCRSIYFDSKLASPWRFSRAAMQWQALED